MIAQSGTNLLKVGYLDLDSVLKIIQGFDNASHKVEKTEPSNEQSEKQAVREGGQFLMTKDSSESQGRRDGSLEVPHPRPG